MSQPLGDPSILLREVTEKSKKLREQAEAMRAELADVLEKVTSRDRAVTVTVGAGGIMRGITVESGGHRSSPQHLVDSIMKAYGEASRRAGEKAADIVARYTPNSPAVAMMRNSVPPGEDEAEGSYR